MSRQQDSAVGPAPARPTLPAPDSPAAPATAPSPLTDPPKQSLRALERANQIRLARAELKRRIRQGELSAAAVIRNPPEEALTWPVIGVLTTQHNWGSSARPRYYVRAQNLLSRLDVRETKPVGELTSHQRERIVRALEGHEKRGGAR